MSLSYELAAFLFVAFVLAFIGWLCLEALRKERKGLEEIILRNGEIFNREKHNG